MKGIDWDFWASERGGTGQCERCRKVVKTMYVCYLFLPSGYEESLDLCTSCCIDYREMAQYEEIS